MASEVSNAVAVKKSKAVFIKVDPDDPKLQEILKLQQDLELIDEELVKLKQTPEQKKAKKRVYRSGYVQKPHVKAKREADKTNPEIIERNLKYATNPIVVKRRTDLATERRGVPSKLKKDHPQLWATYCPLAAAPRTRANISGVKRKRTTSAKKVDSVSLEPEKMDEDVTPEIVQKAEPPKKKSDWNLQRNWKNKSKHPK